MGSVPPPPPTNSEPHSPSTHFKFLDFFSGTRSRLLQAFVRPTFPRSPSILQGRNGETLPSLNYPFQPISPSHSDHEQGDISGYREDYSQDHPSGNGVAALEKTISDLESTMRNVLAEDANNFLEGSNPKDPLQVVSFEDLDQLVPTSSSLREKIPDSIYQEIVAIYQTHLSRDGSDHSSILEQPSKNKERNLRYEVLKWDKD